MQFSMKLSMCTLCLALIPSVVGAQTVLRVDDSAVGTNDGTSWPNAYRHLHDALAVATPGTQIWVAEGIYRPDVGSGQTALARTSTFTIPHGVAVYGAFAGTEASLESRSGSVAGTVLSGDLAGDDVWGMFPTYFENAYHVVSFTGPGAEPILDGFTVVSGNADIGAPVVGGGGCVILGSPARIVGCVFQNNEAFYGGALLIESSQSVHIQRCVFRQNHVVDDGGGIWMAAVSAPVLLACAIVDNVASGGGSSDGGGVFGGTAAFLSCVVARNSARDGGGLYLGPTSQFFGCTIVSNNASRDAGGIFADSPQVITSSILWNNTDAQGQSESSQYRPTLSGTALNYSVVQGLSGVFGGVGNLGADPAFVDASAGDYHLSATSPCIAAGTASIVPFHSIDIDGEGRVQQCKPDIGADESRYFVDCDSDAQADACEIASDPGLDLDSDGVLDACEPVGAAFCFGDGSGTACPCGNTGDVGHGCLSSFGLEGGGLLVASGVASVGADTLCLEASHLPPTTNGLLFQGDQQVNGGLGRLFGDGLRCVSGNVVRIASRTAAAGTIRVGGCVFGDLAISTREPITSGAVRHYQVWYRNSDPTFCTTSLFNLTNGLTVIWHP